MDISRKYRIGYGLYLGHGICMVVSQHTVIGNNVNLSQFLNIGTNRGEGATIGDNVYIDPQACIVEKCISATALISAPEPLWLKMFRQARQSAAYRQESFPTNGRISSSAPMPRSGPEETERVVWPPSPKAVFSMEVGGCARE